MNRIISMIFLAAILISCGKQKNEYDPYDPTLAIKNDTIKTGNSFEIDYKIKYGVKIIHAKFNDAVGFDAILDTGCSGVSISDTEFESLLKTETIYESDVIENGVMLTIADGTTSYVPAVNIRSISVIDQNGTPHVVSNVCAIIQANQSAPVLIGNSVIDNLANGSYTVDLNKQVIRFN